MDTDQAPCLQSGLRFEVGVLDPSCVRRGHRQSKWYPLHGTGLSYSEWEALNEYAASRRTLLRGYTFGLERGDYNPSLLETSEIRDQASLDDLQFCHGIICIENEFSWIFSQLELFLLSATPECVNVVFGRPIEDIFHELGGMFVQGNRPLASELSSYFKIRSMTEKANRLRYSAEQR